MKDVVHLRVEDSSMVGEARRMAASMAREAGLDDVRVGHASIVTTELATNMLKHAGGGDLIVCALTLGETKGIEILSLDKGPGVGDIGKSLCDGYSTMGSRGNGLGAIQRLSSVFDMYSQPDRGTAVLSIIRPPQPADGRPELLEIGAVCLPVATEIACGDAWAVHQSDERVLCMTADGLGHGEYAAEASAAAVEIFETHTSLSPRELIECMHAALRNTRGVAVAVAEVLNDTRIVRYAGIGNISGRIVSGDAVHNMISYNGTVGMQVRKVEEFTYPWSHDALLVLHTDGVATHWNLNDYPGLRMCHPALLAGVLFRDHSRVRDDGTVLVLRETRRSP